MAAFKGRWPLGRGFERYYGFLGGETNSWYPDLVHDNHQIDPRPHRRRATTCPRISPTGRSSSSSTPRPSIPRSRSSSTSPPGPVTHPITSSRSGRTGTRDASTTATRPSGRGSCSARRSWASFPRTPSCRQSPRRAHVTAGRSAWPMLNRAAVGLVDADEQRCMAEVFAGFISYNDQMGRCRLPGGVRSSTTPSWWSTTAPAARAAPTAASTSGASSTASPTPSHPAAHRRAGQPASYNHYTTGWAWAFDTPFPYWKRWAGYEGGVADMCSCRPAKIPRRQPVSITSTSSPPSTSCSGSSRRRAEGLPPEPIEGESFAASLTDVAPARRRVLRARPALIYHQGWLASSTRRSGWGASHDVWELYTSRRTGPRPQPGRRGTGRLETLKSLWSTTRASTRGYRSTTARPSSRSWPTGRMYTPRPRVLPGLRRRPRRLGSFNGRCHRRRCPDRLGRC